MPTLGPLPKPASIPHSTAMASLTCVPTPIMLQTVRDRLNGSIQIKPTSKNFGYAQFKAILYLSRFRVNLSPLTLYVEPKTLNLDLRKPLEPFTDGRFIGNERETNAAILSKSLAWDTCDPPFFKEVIAKFHRVGNPLQLFV